MYIYDSIPSTDEGQKYVVENTVISKHFVVPYVN